MTSESSNTAHANAAAVKALFLKCQQSDSDKGREAILAVADAQLASEVRRLLEAVDAGVVIERVFDFPALLDEPTVSRSGNDDGPDRDSGRGRRTSGDDYREPPTVTASA